MVYTCLCRGDADDYRQVEFAGLQPFKRMTGDYFVLEEDGSTVMHPLSTIHTLKLVKDDESGEMKLEIRLVAKD